MPRLFQLLTNSGRRAHDPVVILERVFGAFQFQQQVGAVVQRLEQVGPGSQRLVKTCQRFLAPVLRRQHIGQIDHHFGQGGLRQNLAIGLFGLRQLTGLLRCLRLVVERLQVHQ